MRAACLSGTLLLAACSFSSPQTGMGDDGGGGGGADAPPACADGDTDADTVCNAADKCADHDDRIDVDADGIPDGCDDWPCGLTKPDDPGSPMGDSSGDRAWGAAFINIGDSRRVVAAPGQRFNAQFGWSIEVDCGDPESCQAQLEIGYGTERVGCVFDGTVDDDTPKVSGGTYPLTAPPTPGVYEIRLNAGVRTSCGMDLPWYGTDPGSDSAIAILCVP
jgi:hypothetical protein